MPFYVEMRQHAFGGLMGIGDILGKAQLVLETLWAMLAE